MNLGLNKKVPQSSSSSICRKPLFDLTNLPSRELLIEKGSFSRPDSTKSIRSRVSVNELNRTKLIEVHSKKNSSLNSLGQNSSKLKPFCKNHKNRTAMHEIIFERAQYFCFECSLIYARQGYKIKAVKTNNDESCQFQREKQTKNILDKCTVVQSQIIEWKKRQNCAIKQIYKQFNELSNNEKIKMQSEIQRITEGYHLTIKGLERSRQQKIDSFRQINKEIEGMCKKIEMIKIDIQNNYEDCIHIFNASQFSTIMNQYWSQIKQFQNFCKQNSVQSLNKKLEDMKGTVRTMGRSGNQFTFSKEPNFDTPPLNKEIRGIKLVESNPDSNRYESSDKESIVDAKINFNDFRI